LIGLLGIDMAEDKLLVALILLLAVAIAAAYFARMWWKKFYSVTVYDYQTGLKYKNGLLEGTVGAGRHRVYEPTSSISVVDMRPTMLTLAGQDIMTKDKVNLKLSLTLTFHIADAVLATHTNGSAHSVLYDNAQIALRDAVAARNFEDVLDKRSEIDAEILARVTEEAKELGFSVTKLGIRDVILPPNLKRAFAGVLEAQKEAQRKIEEARGEHAVLRNLANASALFQQNPMLYQTRLLQALSSGNNSVVLNVDGAAAPTKPAKPNAKP
jgi:regulator of protease activity HflC (stomatin/prohibitin superfamily)